MQKVTLNEIDYQVDDFLDRFIIQQKPSSHIAFYGLSDATLFVQFTSGACWLYYLTLEQAKQVETVGSIGVFVSALKGKTQGQAAEPNLVKCLKRETVVLNKEILSSSNQVYGKKHEEVFLVRVDGDTCTVENMKSGQRYPILVNNTMRKAA